MNECKKLSVKSKNPSAKSKKPMTAHLQESRFDQSLFYSLQSGAKVSKTSSKKFDFLKHLEKMNSWFLVRRYPDDLNGSEMKKFKLTSKNRNAKRYKSLKAVAFVTTSYPTLKSMNKVILKVLDLLYMDKEIQISSFRTARKLSSYLLRVKLYPTERTVGSYILFLIGIKFS